MSKVQASPVVTLPTGKMWFGIPLGEPIAVYRMHTIRVLINVLTTVLSTVHDLRVLELAPHVHYLLRTEQQKKANAGHYMFVFMPLLNSHRVSPYGPAGMFLKAGSVEKHLAEHKYELFDLRKLARKFYV